MSSVEARSVATQRKSGKPLSASHSCSDTALTAADLMSPEVYARDRKGWHAHAAGHRDARTIHVGPNAILIFEDHLTIRHQLQEMIRAERLSEPASVQAEIDSYRFLLPDGNNFKATFMLEFTDAGERRALSPSLVGIERAVWMRVEGLIPIFGRPSDERETPARAAHLLHRLAFDLNLYDVRHLQAGASLSVGIDHERYKASLLMHENQRALLLDDLH